MTNTTTAIVLCLGAATRMRPLSLTCPKALLPFCGRPLLEYTLDQLRDSRIADMVIVAGLHDAGFERYESARLFGEMNIRVVRCGLEHGSGGILKHVVELAGIDSAQVLVIYGDSLLQMDFAAFLFDHQVKASKGCQVSIACHSPDDLALPGKANTNYGILWLADGDRCVRFSEKPLVTELSSHLASAGVFVLNRGILMQLPNERPFDLSGGFLTKLATGEASPVFGFHLHDGYRFDIGTIADYVTKQFAALDGKIRVKNVAPMQRLCLGEGVKIGKDTLLSGHNIFGNHVLVGDRCEITNCVVLDGSVIGNDVKMTGVVLGRACKIHDDAILKSETTLAIIAPYDEVL